MKNEIQTEQASQHMAGGLTDIHYIFLIYIFTLSLLKTRFKGVDETPFVHVPQKEIEQRFFKWPDYSRDKEIKKLIKAGYLAKKKLYSPTVGRMIDAYQCLRQCAPDPSLIITDTPVLGKTQKWMLDCLLNTDLAPDSLSTPYFDFFLKHKKEYPYLFFKFDNFSGRLHTPVTSFPAAYREHLLLYGQKVASLDVSQMQPQILGKILKDNLRDNQFSRWMDSGADVYRMMAAAANMNTRAEGKKRFFEILFGRPNDNLAAVFGNANWIDWINRYKRKRITANPHHQKQHTNLAWLLQKNEVAIMKSIWIKLTEKNIPFLTIHDEINCRLQDRDAAAEIFYIVLSENFEKFELNVTP
jgi:hypothetical protein